MPVPHQSILLSALHNYCITVFRNYKQRFGGYVMSRECTSPTLTEHIVHIGGVVGSSPTVTTTNPVGVQVQRLPDFFAYPSRVRTFRSQEYALFCQRGTQKGYAVHLKTAYPWKHFVHIHRDALANFRFFHQKHKQLTSSFSFEFRMPNRKKFQKIINTHLVAVL